MRAGQRRPIKKSKVKKPDIDRSDHNLCDQILKNIPEFEDEINFLKIKTIKDKQKLPICDRILSKIPDIKKRFNDNNRVFIIFFENQLDLINYLTTDKNIAITATPSTWDEYDIIKNI